MAGKDISIIMMDMTKFDKTMQSIYTGMCKIYKYSTTAKLAKGEFYKFLTTLEVPEKIHRETMNKLIKPDCMNARSILGLEPVTGVIKVVKPKLTIVIPEKKVEEVEESEPADEEEEQEEEESEEESIPARITRKIGARTKKIQGTSLVESFRMMKFVILQMQDMTEEDVKAMTLGDIKVLIKLLKMTHTSMYRVAEKYFPESEYKRIK